MICRFLHVNTFDNNNCIILKVSLEMQCAEVQYDATRVQLNQIIETIEDAGFDAKVKDEGANGICT